LYLADSGNFRVRKISPAGVITTIAGNGNAGYSRLTHGTGFATGKEGY